eukprot:1807593-Prymnesium_polylepis.2
MAESPTYFNAVHPVLKALQMYDPGALPFEEELVYVQEGGPPPYLEAEGCQLDLSIIFKNTAAEEDEDPAAPRTRINASVDELLLALQLGSVSDTPVEPTQPRSQPRWAKGPDPDGGRGFAAGRGKPLQQPPPIDKRPRTRSTTTMPPPPPPPPTPPPPPPAPPSPPENLTTTLDPSQRRAVAVALQRRVVTIQGPPGTGESFIGRLLAQLLLSVTSRPPGPILLITFKNHALDEFLEPCIGPVPLSKIARVGSRSKSPLLLERNLTKLVAHFKLAARKSDEGAAIQDELAELRNRVDQLVPELMSLTRRREVAALISIDSLICAFLAEATDEQLEQMWLNKRQGLGKYSQELLQDLARQINLVWPRDSDGEEQERNFFGEACKYSVLCAQRKQHIPEI